jgi:hypothetical protein
MPPSTRQKSMARIQCHLACGNEHRRDPEVRGQKVISFDFEIFVKINMDTIVSAVRTVASAAA